jgi:L-fuconolactonase
VRIDAHQHFWRYNSAEYPWIDDTMAVLRRDFLPGDARREMDCAAVDVCVAVQARQTLDETRWLLDLAAANPFIAGVVGWVDLQADDVESQLRPFAAGSKLVGVRHIAQSEEDDRFLLGSAFCRGVSVLRHFDLTYDILIYPKHLAVAGEFVSRFPSQRFILDHLAKPRIAAGDIQEWETGIRTLAGFPHVFCKLSGLVTEADWQRWTPAEIRPYLDVVFDCFGVDRLLAGSDWPVCLLAASYARTFELIDTYMSGRPSAERDAVMGGNAARLWRLRAGELV